MSPRHRIRRLAALSGLLTVAGGCTEGELGVRRIEETPPETGDALVGGSPDAEAPRGSGLWPTPDAPDSDAAREAPDPADPRDPEPARDDAGADEPSPDAARPPPTAPPTAAPTTPPPAACEGGRWTQTIHGHERRSRVDVPAGYGAGGPLVLALHGNGDDAANFCATSGVCAFAAAQGAMVLAPDGRERVIEAFGQQIPGSWDAYDTDPAANEDLALLDALVAEADARCAPGVVYVWGHSQGGYFGFAYAMQRADRVAGAAISAAADPMPGFGWQPARRIPFYFLIGDADFGIDNARQTASRLEGAGHPVHLEVLPGVGHGGYQDGREAEIWAFLTSGR
jgi:pimeloyl-ACP methyl ester carboxylesterase